MVGQSRAGTSSPRRAALYGTSVQAGTRRSANQGSAAGLPAEQAGLVAGDEIIALNGWRVKAEDWSERLREYPVGETIHLTWFHDQQLHSGTLMLGDPQPRYQVQCRADAMPSQRAHLEAWLGVTAAKL